MVQKVEKQIQASGLCVLKRLKNFMVRFLRVPNYHKQNSARCFIVRLITREDQGPYSDFQGRASSPRPKLQSSWIPTRGSTPKVTGGVLCTCRGFSLDLLFPNIIGGSEVLGSGGEGSWHFWFWALGIQVFGVS